MARNRRSDVVFVPSRYNVWGRDFASIPTYPETVGSNVTRIEWKETPEAHVFKADVPGHKKEEVMVEIEDGKVLMIAGQRILEPAAKNETWIRVERSSGKFKRRFQLPEKPKLEQVKASLENGVLTVTLPKEEVNKPNDAEESIEISSG